MLSVQPYLPWLLLVSVAILGHARFRRWSIAYSNRVIKELESRIENPAAARIPAPKADTSPLGIRRRLIWDHVETLPVDANRRIESLVADLASVSLCLDLEKTYGAIFRSQVSFLRNLNLIDGPIECPTAVKWFAELASENPELKKLEFSPWLQFLTERGLIVVAEGRIAMTAIGQEFLLWMIRERKPEKPYERF